MIFFTSDHHFGHENIIKYCDRPFANVDEMDTQMVERWNNRVSESDFVYYLGDFTLFNDIAAKRYFSQLNGAIRILNNHWHHDKRWIENADGIVSKTGSRIKVIQSLVVLEFSEYDGRFPLAVSLCHYPLAEWDRKHYSGWHLHGHSHGKHKANGFIMDVGVDSNDFAPVSLNDVEKRMRSLGWEIVSN